MEKEYAQFLCQATKKNYNLIAKDYTRTRAFIPEDIKELAALAERDDKILDSGCANGRLVEAFQEKVDYFGVDQSEELISIARKNYPQAKFQAADSLYLPFLQQV